MGQVCGLYQVDQSTVVVKEKFSTVLSPGCQCPMVLRCQCCKCSVPSHPAA
jgi:hypothetical protein